MSKYTTELRYICESLSGLSASVGGNSVEEIISKARPIIFSFDYPIFDTKYKEVLETKILKHFYTREIGMETYGAWKLMLNKSMNEIMPYYNMMYKSNLLEFNPFYDVDLSRTHDNNNTGKTTNVGSTNGTSTGTETKNSSTTDKNLYSDTPQGAITNLESETYLTNATIDTGTETGTNTTSGTNTQTQNSTVDLQTTEKYLETVKGKQGGASFSALLLEYRKTFTNVDMLVINDLNDLFMGLW